MTSILTSSPLARILTYCSTKNTQEKSLWSLGSFVADICTNHSQNLARIGCGEPRLDEPLNLRGF